MIFTQEDAKKRRCPNDLNRNCVSSNCMAWRWVMRMEDPTTEKGVNFAKLLNPNFLSPTKGYCGLAKIESPEVSQLFDYSYEGADDMKGEQK